jgi:hypothetical protein
MKGVTAWGGLVGMRQADFFIAITLFKLISLKKTCAILCVTVCHTYM